MVDVGATAGIVVVGSGGSLRGNALGDAIQPDGSGRTDRLIRVTIPSQARFSAAGYGCPAMQGAAARGGKMQRR